jgi:hypothetical protein
MNNTSLASSKKSVEHIREAGMAEATLEVTVLWVAQKQTNSFTRSAASTLAELMPHVALMLHIHATWDILSRRQAKGHGSQP